MSCERFRNQVDDYLDGDLGPQEMAALQAHLAACTTCTAFVGQERRLLNRLGSLPPTIEPARDLWPAIEDSIRPQPRRWVVLAAAALALVVLSSGLTWLAARPDKPSGPPEQELVGSLPSPETVPDWESDFRVASAELEQSVDSRRDELDPTTLAVIDHNLAVIDVAIEECRAALKATPSDPRLNRALLAAWTRKVDLLQYTSQLRSTS